MSSQLDEFLNFQAKKNPIHIDRTKLSWEEKSPKNSSRTTGSSNLLDAIYLRKPPEETVVVERSVAALIQERISNLEEEITRLRTRIRFLKIAILVFFIGIMGLVGEVIVLLKG
ncbi:MAG: hypothetical protein ACUVTL_09650 [Thermoproteota archaeon]